MKQCSHHALGAMCFLSFVCCFQKLAAKWISVPDLPLGDSGDDEEMYKVTPESDAQAKKNEEAGDVAVVKRGENKTPAPEIYNRTPIVTCKPTHDWLLLVIGCGISVTGVVHTLQVDCGADNHLMHLDGVNLENLRDTNMTFTTAGKGQTLYPRLGSTRFILCNKAANAVSRSCIKIEQDETPAAAAASSSSSSSAAASSSSCGAAADSTMFAQRLAFNVSKVYQCADASKNLLSVMALIDDFPGTTAVLHEKGGVINLGAGNGSPAQKIPVQRIGRGWYVKMYVISLV
jgi:hypothetical protein